MRIGLFFGSFNPIHKGHTQLAEYILRNCHMDEIWFVISPNNPLKDKNTLWDEELRKQLVDLAIEGKKRFKSCDIEFELPRPNYTANSLRTLTAKFPEHTFFVIIGSDNMAKFDQWREWQWIENNYEILVYPREGDNMEALKEKFPIMHIVDDAPKFKISGTEIRDKIQKREYTNDWLDKKVREKIEIEFK